jgi:hypothetical protein
LARSDRLVRRTPLQRAPFSAASEAQRGKVAGLACLVCSERPSGRGCFRGRFELPQRAAPRPPAGTDQFLTRPIGPHEQAVVARP